MLNVLCVLYPDPVSGYPTDYPRNDLPELPGYPNGQTLPSPNAIDFKPGSLLGSVSGELGLRPFLEKLGHRLVVTSDKEGFESVFEKELSQADILISQPFWPAYVTAAHFQRAKRLKLVVTAGIGSDHIDLQAAARAGATVAEVTYSNSNSVAEHVVMMILALVRNYMPSHEWVNKGGWNIADCAMRAYDLEGMQVGTVGAGRIGLGVLKRLKGFDVKLHYTDQHRLSSDMEKEYNLVYHPSVDDMLPLCDVVTINCPLHPGTEGLFNGERINRMKRGAYLINTARGKICDDNAVCLALTQGQLAGYAGDVWYPQPAPKDHVWRTMPHQAMTPHMSGTTLSAQTRYAAGVREILECWLAGCDIRDEYLIVKGGKLAGSGAHAYTLASESTCKTGSVAVP